MIIHLTKIADFLIFLSFFIVKIWRSENYLLYLQPKNEKHHYDMPLSPEQVAKIRQKESEKPDALKRDPLNDYTEGWFHVTLSTRDKVPVLGYLVGDANAPDGSPQEPRCELTELGKAVEQSWNANPSFYPYIENIAFQVMPEHVHGLVHLKPGNKKHLGQIIWGFMVGCSHGYWDLLGIKWREMTYEKGARAPEWQDRDHTMSKRGPALFVRGYNDVEAVTPEEIETKRQYIHNNPRKRLLQRDRHECFRKYRHQHSSNWTVARVMSAITADRTFSYDAQRREAAMLNIHTKLNKDLPQNEATANTGAASYCAQYVTTMTLPSGRQVTMPGIGLDYIGNKALLYGNKKLPLVCHRADVALFEQQKSAVLDAARKGYVIVSAFISPKERDIKLQLMVEQLPFIEILDNGISDKYKGVGKAFYAIAENRLCQITPWQYQYQKEIKVSREMCLVMNHLALIISGVRDDWWKDSVQF